jgi:hypothetical protein
MTIEQLRDEVVLRGKEAASRDYNRPDQAAKLRGSLAGFDRAAVLPLNPEQFEAEIAKLEAELGEMRKRMRKRQDREGYWEKRCFQAEIEWTFSILCVGWRWGTSFSSRAAMFYNNVLTEFEQKEVVR